jgi:hypothetical protein
LVVAELLERQVAEQVFLVVLAVKVATVLFRYREQLSAMERFIVCYLVAAVVVRQRVLLRHLLGSVRAMVLVRTMVLVAAHAFPTALKV